MAAAEVNLTSFVDFVVASGGARITKVAEIKNRPEYNPAFDFYRPLRNAIVEMHSRGTDPADLQYILKDLTDPKKIAGYPSLIASYSRLAKTQKSSWFQPNRAAWEHAGLSVSVNPELGLQVNGVKHLVKLYFKSGLQPSRLGVIHEIMRASLGTAGEPIMAVTDVAAGKMHVPRKRKGMDVLLKSEAAAFMEIWNAL